MEASVFSPFFIEHLAKEIMLINILYTSMCFALPFCIVLYVHLSQSSQPQSWLLKDIGSICEGPTQMQFSHYILKIVFFFFSLSLKTIYRNKS